ncbi:MAG: hypothetical protein J2P27_17235, partial [Actinobacteria bacterium]|nr:hypothetical protein [Actinomycetota bacterium]
TGAELFNCFSFGIGQAMVITGQTTGLTAYGHGVDNASQAVTVDGELRRGRFANANLVSISPQDANDGKRYLLTTPNFRGDLAIFGLMGWACDYGSELNGAGSVTIQQALILKGSVTANAGQLHLDSSFVHGDPHWTTTRNYPQVQAGAGVQGGAVLANVGVALVDQYRSDPTAIVDVPVGFAVVGAGAAALTQSGNVSSAARY